MRAYDSEYYDDEEGYIDEYEEEGDEEQEEAREPPKPTKEEKEFLSRRERLKEMYRQKMLKERASTFGRTSVHEAPKTPSQDKFGSFFGPSLPGIAQRVIEETKSMKENGYTYSSSKSTAASTTKGTAQMSSRPKSSNGQQSHGPKKVNEVKKKVEILKGNRDYSFLFSDDADEPNGPSAKNSSQLKSDPSTSHPSSAKHVKEASRGHPTGPNGSRSAPSTTGPSTLRYSQLHNRPGSTAQRYQQQLNQRPGTSRQPQPPSNRPRPISNGSHHPSPSTGAKAPGTAKAANKAPMKTVNGSSNHQSVVRRATSVAPNQRPHVSSSMQRHPTQEKRAGPVSARPGIKSGPPSKPQPFKQISSREHVRPISSNGNGRVREDERRNVAIKKKAVAKRPFDDEDDDHAIDMIRKMFNYNPNRWAGRDEDDSDMEVGFDTIMKEERLSSKIARQEDEEQLRLIEEEERRERERMRKRQKLRHG